MPAKNTPTSSTNVEAVRAQAFLELAAPIILDRHELDESTWEELRDLARRTGLSEEELTRVVDSLRQGGVIAGTVIAGTVIAETTAAPLGVFSEDDEVEWWNQVAHPAPPPVVAPVVPDARRWANAEHRQRVATFLDRARTVVAENRGIDARAYAILADFAHSLGLNESQFDEAMRSLGGAPLASPTAAAPPEPPPVTRDPNAGRVEGRPADAYRQYLRLAIHEKKKSRGYLSLSAERKLIDEGARKLGLSRVFARHVIHEEATALEVPILSQREDRPAESEDPQFEEFVARALPVLAQERGVTPKARMMLAAIAREMKLDDQAIQQAVDMLQRGSTAKNGAARDQSERREAFVTDLNRSLASGAGGVMAPPAHQQLLWRAEQLYGLASSEGRAAIHEVASKVGMSIVSLEQAAQYVSALIRERLGTAPHLRTNDEWEVLAQGEQWGFTAEQCKQLIASCVQSRNLRVRRERWIIGAALTGSGLAVVVLLGAFYWVVLHDRIAKHLLPDEPSPPVPTSVTERPAAAPSPDMATASGGAPEEWWTVEMDVLKVTIRRAMTDAEKIELVKLDPADAANRSAAYVGLVPIAVRAENASTQVRPLGELLARCLARDSDPGALQTLTHELLARMIDPLADSDSSATDLDKEFAALRIMIAAIEGMGAPVERQLALTTSLEDGLGESIRLGEAKGALENQLFAAMLKNVLRSLARQVAKRGPVSTARLITELRPSMKRYLSAAELRKQLAEILKEGLPASGTDWNVYEPLLTEVLADRDPLLIAKLVEAFERGGSEPLRNFLGSHLLAAVGKSWTDAGTVDKVPAMVREALGLPTSPVLTRTDRVRIFMERATNLLRSEQPPSSRDELMMEIAGLSRTATLGLCLARNDDRRFDEILALETVPLAADAPVVEEPSDPRDELGMPFDQAPQVGRWVDGLKRAKQLNERLALLESLRGLTESVAEIHPDAAEELAKYLLSSRNSTEHNQRLARLEGFHKWNNLKIALAQEFDGMGAYDEQIAQTMSRLIPTEHAIPEDGNWSAHWRLALLTEVIDHLAVRSTESVEKAKDRTSVLQQSLRGDWRWRLLILGIDRDVEPGEPATGMLRESVLAMAATMRKKAESAPDKLIRLAALQHEITAADFLAVHDLELAVRLEMISTELLAFEIDLESQGDSGARILSDGANETSRDLYQQLWGTQRLALRLLLAMADGGDA